MNEHNIVGNLGADVEVNETKAGVSVGNLRVATSTYYKDAEGNRQQRTQWHRVAVFNLNSKLAEHLRKGRLVRIKGTVETSRYTDSSGIERFRTQTIVRPRVGEVQLLGRAPQAEKKEEN